MLRSLKSVLCVFSAFIIISQSLTDLGAAESRFDPEVAAALEKVFPALVQISVVSTSPSSGRMEKTQGAGSGAIISKDGHVITNHHVSRRGIRFICRLPDGEEVNATLVGTDPLSDISVLKLDTDFFKENDRPIPIAEFGDSDAISVGDTVYAMGSPAALSQSVTRGIVSNKALIMSSFIGTMRLDGENVGSLVRWIAHDARIFGGNSGGPLVDVNGKIIGINEIGVAGLGGAIPSNLARSVAEQIIEKGYVDRSWLGIDAQPLLRDMRHLRGILVGGTIAGSPAESAGILPGDVITKYDGSPVEGRIAEDIPQFNAMVMSTPINSTVELEILRDGETITIEAETVPRSAARGDDFEILTWGMTVRNLTKLAALEMKRPDTDGVLVVTMRPGGPTQEARPRLEGNDVILTVAGQPVRNIADLNRISEDSIGDSDERVPVIVEIARAGENVMTVVRIGIEPDAKPPAQARRPWLPIVSQVLTRQLAEALKIDSGGVRITQLYPERSAETAGMQVGDILIKIDGEPIRAFEPEDSEVLNHMIRQYRVGTEVEIELIRSGEKISKMVELEERERSREHLDSHDNEHLEFAVREISMEDRVARQIPLDVEGLLVSQVSRAGWAALAGLQANDILISVDGVKVDEVDKLEELLDRVVENQADRVVLFVRRGIRTIYLQIEPRWEDPEELN